MDIRMLIAVALSGSLLFGGSLALAKDNEGVNDPNRDTSPKTEQGMQNQDKVEKKAKKVKKKAKRKAKKTKKAVKKSTEKTTPAEPAPETTPQK